MATALKKLTEFIENQHLSQMKRWSERYRLDAHGKKSRYLKSLIRQIRAILVLISGNDVVKMIQGIFS